MKTSSKNLVLKKGAFLTKFHFYIKHSMEISGKGLLHFYQETSSLMGSQANHRTNMLCLMNPTLAMSWTMMHLYCDLWKNMQCSFKYFEQCILSKYNVNATIMDPNNFYKHQYM